MKIVSVYLFFTSILFSDAATAHDIHHSRLRRDSRHSGKTVVKFDINTAKFYINIYPRYSKAPKKPNKHKKYHKKNKRKPKKQGKTAEPTKEPKEMGRQTLHVDALDAAGIPVIATATCDEEQKCTGTLRNPTCRPSLCLDYICTPSTTKKYVPGCCTPPDDSGVSYKWEQGTIVECENAVEPYCDEQCPDDACNLTETGYQCSSPEYQLSDQFLYGIDCLDTSEDENGLKWAVACGPVLEGPRPEFNFDVGEYWCMAFRTGGGFTHEKDGLLSFRVPCQFVQISECGCAPADMFYDPTFYPDVPLDDENKTIPCNTTDDCPFLCSDAGTHWAKRLCHVFEDFGGMEWWEGNNNIPMFSDTKPELKGLDLFLNGTEGIIQINNESPPPSH